MRKLVLFVWLIMEVVTTAQTWTEITTNIPGPFVAADPSSNRTQPIASDGTYLYLLGVTGVYRTAAGQTFEPINTVEGTTLYGLTNLYLNFVKFENGFVWVGSDQLQPQTPLGAAALHRLHPGETTWQKAVVSGILADSICWMKDLAYDSSTGHYYLPSLSPRGVFVSANGLDWVLTTNAATWPTFVIAQAGQALVTDGSTPYGIYKTSDHGATWSKTIAPAGWYQGKLLRHGSRILIPIDLSPLSFSSIDGIYYTDDFGDSWRLATPAAFGEANFQWDLLSDGATLYRSHLVGNLDGPKFSVTDGLTWDNLPTTTTSLPSTILRYNTHHVIRHGPYLFAIAQESFKPARLFRIPIADIDFTPHPAIAFTAYPQPTALLAGETFFLQVQVFAVGVTPSYQWQKLVSSTTYTNVPGATAPTFTVTNAATNHSGSYRCVVSGGGQSLQSSAASVQVFERRDGGFDPRMGDLDTRTGNNQNEVTRLFVQADGSVVAIGTAGIVQRIGPEGGIVNQRASWSDFGLNPAILAHSHPNGMIDSEGRLLLCMRLTQRNNPGDRNPIFKYVVQRVFADQTGFPDDSSFPPLELLGGEANSISEVPGIGYAVVGGFTNVVTLTGTNTAMKVLLLDYGGQTIPMFNLGDGLSDGGLAELLPPRERRVIPEWNFSAGVLSSVATASSGSIWISGGFQSWNGINASQLMKISPTSGDITADFTPYYTADGSNLISAAKLLRSGKVLVCLGVEGDHPLQLLKPDGTFDPNFNIANGTLSAQFIDVAEQADGKIIMIFGPDRESTGGSTASVFGNIVSGYARINADGAFDPTFYTGQHYGPPKCLAYDPRGYVYFGFGPTVVRVFATPAESIRLSAVLISADQFRLRLMTGIGHSYTIEWSSNLTSWTYLTNFVSTGATTDFLESIPSSSAQRFYRAR